MFRRIRGWVAVLATVAQLFLTSAYAQAPAGQVGPFVYTAVVFAAGFDYVLWGRLPDPLSGLGAVLVVTAGILTLRALGTRRPGSAPQSPSRNDRTSARS